MSIINFTEKKQARDEWEAEGMKLYRQLCECTTPEERGALAVAFVNGDEAQMDAIAEQVQARYRRSPVDALEEMANAINKGGAA